MSRLQQDKTAMEYKHSFKCGNNTYYVTKQDGRFIVSRQGWIEKALVGYARDMAQAMAFIRRDARSGEIRAA